MSPSTNAVLTPQRPTAPINGDATLSPPPPSMAVPPRRGMSRPPILLAGVLAISTIAGGFLAGRLTATSSNAAASVHTIAGDSATTVASGASTAAALVEKGLAAHVAGQFDEAKGFYTQALAADPTNKFAHFNLGQIAQTQKDLPSAITSYEACLKIDPNYLPALFNSALAYGSNGNTKQAIVNLRKASVLSPTDAKVMFTLGRLLVADGQSDEGTKLMGDAVNLDPSLKTTN